MSPQITCRLRCLPGRLTRRWPLLLLILLAMAVILSISLLRAGGALNFFPEDYSYASLFEDGGGKRRVKFSDRDLEMFRYAFNWLETKTSFCDNLRILGANSTTSRNGQTFPALGSKRICLEPPMPNSADDGHTCLVLSFGLYDEIPLESELASLGCRVHAFDPQRPHVTLTPSERIHYHKTALHRLNGELDGRALASLDALLHRLRLRGRTLQLLQVDINGEEAYMLMQQLFDKEEGLLVLDVAEQISIVFNVPTDVSRYSSMVAYDLLENSFKVMNQMGYNVVYTDCLSDREHHYPGLSRSVCNKYEVLLLKNERDTWDRLERGNVPLRREGFYASSH